MKNARLGGNRNGQLKPRRIRQSASLGTAFYAIRPNPEGRIMPNVLKREKQLSIFRCLVEGNSIRSTERMTGIHRDTITRNLVRFGNECAAYHNDSMRNIVAKHVQCDEIWTFVGKKDKQLTGREKRRGELGSQYLFLGIEEDTKLLISYAIGKRNAQTTGEFVSDLESRLFRPPVGSLTDDQKVQISTDGWSSYCPTIASMFGDTAKHGVLIKQYVNPEVGRYSPPDLMKAKRENVRGIKDIWSICTSHIERCNLTIRTFMKRFTRLALGFSKKLDNLVSATSLFVAYHNFCWRSRLPGSTGKKRPTPAMASGLVDELWDLERLFDEVSEHAKTLRARAKTRRLLDRMAQTD